jgi:TRAP-type C4-dicarboxylate transport system substrate-binding protein
MVIKMQKQGLYAVVAVLLFSVCAGVSAKQVTLRLGHQWPGDVGDIRHEMAKIIQAELKQKNIGIELKILPNNESGYKPWQQWSAVAAGKLDMSIYPLAYAGPKHPEFNLTLMPGIIKNHEHAARFNKSKVMRSIKRIMEQAGVIVIADAWLAGGIVSNKRCIEQPRDAKGLTMRAAGIAYNQMLEEAGANIASMPSNKIREAMHNDTLQGAITSSSSLVSYKIYEETKCLIAPGKLAIWFMYEPIIMSKKRFDSLTQQQQEVLLTAGKKAEKYGALEARKADTILINTYKQHGVEVKELTDKEFQEWRDVAEDSSYKKFRDGVRNGKELLKWALEDSK